MLLIARWIRSISRRISILVVRWVSLRLRILRSRILRLRRVLLRLTRLTVVGSLLPRNSKLGFQIRLEPEAAECDRNDNGSKNAAHADTGIYTRFRPKRRGLYCKHLAVRGPRNDG